MQRADALEKNLTLGKTEGKKEKREERIKWLDSITKSKDINLSKLLEIVEDRETWRAAAHEAAKSWT